MVDIDGDDRPDLAEANFTPNSVSVLRHTGQFAPPVITSFVPASGSVGTSVFITGANFDPTPANNIVFFGATKANVTAATTTQLTVNVPYGASYEPISVLVNNLSAYSSKPFGVTFAGGPGIRTNSFATHIDFTANSQSQYIGGADFDGDGKSDLAATNRGTNNVSLFRNTSTGPGIISYAGKIDFATGSQARHVATADFDGDGKPDMAVANPGVNTVSVFQNTSSGIGIITFAPKVDLTSGINPYTIAIGDYDKDGKVDIAVTQFWRKYNLVIS